jgi:hypothetical protein
LLAYWQAMTARVRDRALYLPALLSIAVFVILNARAGANRDFWCTWADGTCRSI